MPDGSMILAMISMGAAFTAAVISCTWILATKAKGIVDSNRRLGAAMDALSQNFNSHLLRSDTRDRDNEAAHSDFRRSLDGNQARIAAVEKRIEEVVFGRIGRLEVMVDRHETRGSELDKRMSLLEA